MTASEHTAVDPFLQQAQASVVAVDAAIADFETESEKDLELLEEQLGEARSELEGAAGDIEKAAMEANADIDDAVLALISDEEAE